MTEKFAKKIVFLSALIAILGFSAQGFAQMGMGQHHYGGMHHGPGWHHQGCGPRGYDSWGNLSEDELKQIEEERKAFFEATKEIRQQLYQKRLEIRSELAKKIPDAEVAAELQKEISALKAQMGQKRLDHILKLKKINPDIGRGLMGRGRMGYLMRGSRGYGGCPNCPYHKNLMEQ
ncbi:MAG: periplasmic heavy metal sensor [Desulfobacterales bacterium]